MTTGLKSKFKIWKPSSSHEKRLEGTKLALLDCAVTIKEDQCGRRLQEAHTQRPIPAFSIHTNTGVKHRRKSERTTRKESPLCLWISKWAFNRAKRAKKEKKKQRNRTIENENLGEKVQRFPTENIQTA
ncbi:hypothetical protein NQD34_005801 [Periophthalmus magnuspinnatus]|nr:hypothetical protein NQD34_005801 [Periophthalmus magnuspinnatus]